MGRNQLRGRFDQGVPDEIKRVALRQLEHGGVASVSVNAIGRELAVSGPAIYRYFAGRDELLTALIVDAYDDLADELSRAVSGARTARTRLAAFARAYREFARREPHRYRLLYRAPMPGYEPNTPELVRASQAAMNVLLGALGNVADTGTGAGPDVRAWLRRRGLSPELAPAARRAVEVWTRLHGLVSVEIEGGFASMAIDPGPLYAALAD